ncbi:CGNR zinc finger domain-containing protein [Nonomuraea terrae]|uniref:CGNR zinc finger domain-containing protein n=1 Tax=Nonomuraea terrae TaxID=2530383 RepID=UPI00378D7A67
MAHAPATTSAILLGEPLPVELSNTTGMARGEVYDALADDDAVAAWLRAVGGRLRSETGGTLDPAKLDEADLHGIAGRLRDLRDALRRLAADATGDTRPLGLATVPTRQAAIDTLNALAPAWPELVWPEDGEPAKAFHAPGPRAELAVSLIAHQGVELFAGPRRDLLRACQAPNCLLFFLKTHPRREWCGSACGNRARVARHYRQHHAADRTVQSRRHPDDPAPPGERAERR